MDNPEIETLASLGTQDTGGRQTKHNITQKAKFKWSYPGILIIRLYALI